VLPLAASRLQPSLAPLVTALFGSVGDLQPLPLHPLEGFQPAWCLAVAGFAPSSYGVCIRLPSAGSKIVGRSLPERGMPLPGYGRTEPPDGQAERAAP
jgi:hypothetical protein